MATPRKPWPSSEPAQTGFSELLMQTRKIIQLVNEANRLKNHNVKRLTRILFDLAIAGQNLTGIAQRVELHKDDGNRFPNWVNTALRLSRRNGRYIAASAELALDGLYNPVTKKYRDNWKMVIKGLSKALEYANKTEAALCAGPPPEGEGVYHLMCTLEMGRVTTGKNGVRWRNN